MRYQWRSVSKMVVLCAIVLTSTSLLAQTAPISASEKPRDQQKEFTIQNKYLIIPIQDGTRYDDMKSQLRLYVDGKIVHHYRINLAESAQTTDWYAYLTVESYRGKKARVEVDNGHKAGFALVKQSDTIPGEKNFFKEPWRPQLRFSQKVGWNNDPNGLVYLDGTYHFFFQRNPVGLVWGNMTWGHATSTDLLHWEQQSDKIRRRSMATMDALCSMDRTVIRLTSAHGGDAHLISFEAHELKSIWGDKPKRSISPVQE